MICIRFFSLNFFVIQFPEPSPISMLLYLSDINFFVHIFLQDKTRIVLLKVKSLLTRPNTDSFQLQAKSRLKHLLGCFFYILQPVRLSGPNNTRCQLLCNLYLFIIIFSAFMWNAVKQWFHCVKWVPANIVFSCSNHIHLLTHCGFYALSTF